MKADGRRIGHKYQPGPESIPMRDRSPNTSAFHEPPNTEWRTSEEEGRPSSRHDAPTLTVHVRSPALTGGGYPSKKQRLTQDGVTRELKKHTLALYLILVYAFIAILSWSITCVLSFQPIGVPTYFDQSGNYSKSHYEMTDNWRKAASVGQSIVGVISIAVTPAICAKAVAVYCQRTSNARTPSLSLRQMLAFADKGWTDLVTPLNVVTPSRSRTTRSPLSILSADLVAISE